MENIEGEIWYPYTFDLGRDVKDFEKIIDKILELDFVLAGFDSTNETIVYKEKGLIKKTRFVSSEYGPENKYVIENRPKDKLIEKAIHFLGLFRLSEIHHFSANYRHFFQYLRFNLSPIVFNIELNGKDELIILEPSLKITTTGILTVTFRLQFTRKNLHEVIKLENLYSAWLKEIAIPSELVSINQNIASLYHGSKINSQTKKFYLDQIKPYEVYEGINLCSVAADGLRFEHIAENYKYLLIEKLFLGRILKPKDFQKIDRTSYWQCRTSVHIVKYDNQEVNASAILDKRKATLFKLFNRVELPVEHSELMELKNLRVFDDYLLFVNRGLTLQVYSSKQIIEIEEKFKNDQMQREKLWLILGLRVIMDYIDVRFMNLKMWHQLVFSDDLIDQKLLIQKLEEKQEQEFLFETDYINTVELQNVISYTKKEMQFDEIEEIIKKRIDLLSFKSNTVRSNRVFWYGLLISVVFGLANLEKLSSIYFKPFFQQLNWCFGVEHSLIISGVCLFIIIGILSILIKKRTKF
jgi:hypothetical protein